MDAPAVAISGLSLRGMTSRRTEAGGSGNVKLEYLSTPRYRRAFEKVLVLLRVAGVWIRKRKRGQ